MEEIINFLIDNYNIPILTALLLGILTSISPCPLATNIAAVAYIGREIKTAGHTLLNGLFYILGRGVSYSLLAVLVYYGFSLFKISSFFRGWGGKALGPILIAIGLVLLGVVKLNVGVGEGGMDRIKLWLSKKGYAGSFLLGMIFALAFCPSSGVLFFGALIPLILNTEGGLLLVPFFAIGTGLPVMVFSFLLVFSLQEVGRAFQMTQKIEKFMRYGTAYIFIGAGIYYARYLILYLVSTGK